MTPNWKKLFKLFSITPAFRLSDRTRLFIELQRTPRSTVLWAAPRVILLFLYFTVFDLGLYLLVGGVLLTAFLCSDLRNYSASQRYRYIGFDGAWFLADQEGGRLDVALTGEVVTNGYFVALNFRVENIGANLGPLLDRPNDSIRGKCQSHLGFGAELIDGFKAYARPRSVSYVCGSWNLSNTDFHSLRLTLTSV